MSTLMIDDFGQYLEREDMFVPVTIKESLESLHMDIEALQKMNDGETFRSESLWSFFKNLLSSIGNTVLHVMNLFKTNIFKSYLTLKRTEIRHYNESNMISVKQIFETQYTTIAPILVPQPVGMVKSYLETISRTKDALENIDIAMKSKLAVKVTSDILASLKKGSELGSLLSESISLLDPSSVRDVVISAQSCINQRARVAASKPFEEMFVSMSDFKKCNDMALSAEQFVNQTAYAHKSMAQCHENFSQIISLVGNAVGNTVTKSDIENLAVLAYDIAELFDMFASMLTNYHIIEHNLVEVFKEVRRQLNL